ncbi:MAG: GHKL domain-containing protein [Lachnospiraceae bacterium]|nr:GHKL domain-containing protein [Lachnospiraceae bacterium]
MRSFYFWVNFVIGGILYPYGIAFVWSFMLTSRWKKCSKFLAATAMVLAVLGPGVVRILDIGGPLFVLMEIVQLILFILYLGIFFVDPWWKKLMTFVFFVVLAHAAEIIVLPFFTSMGLVYNFDFGTYELFVFQTLCCIVNLSLSTVLVMVWNAVTKRQRPPRNAGVFLLFPISQLLLMRNVNRVYIPETPVLHQMLFATLGIALSFVADLVFFYLLMAQGERDALEEQVRELEHMRHVEQLHYQSVEARRKELAKIRHDFNNQLTVALHLAGEGFNDQSRKIPEELKEKIAKTKEYAWCGNAVVNAVLEEKAADCRREKIIFSAELEIGNENEIEPIHLCSIFSNLMDNAIRAASKCSETDRRISLRAARKGDYLHIKAENTALRPTKETRPKGRHGYGQEILRDIAAQYNGEFRTEWSDGIYTAVLSLELIKTV